MEVETETIETIHKIILPPSGGSKTDQELIDNFLSHTEEKQEYQTLKGIESLAKVLGKEVPKKVKEKLEQYEKKLGGKNKIINEDISENSGASEQLEVQGELRDFREKWKEKISLDKSIKEKIIKVAENIPVKVGVDRDGSRLIEFKLGNKTYKILDPKLETHTDEEYKSQVLDSLIDEYCVKLGGMWGDDKNRWKNIKLKEYVDQNEQEGLHIPKIEEMVNLLGELGKQINSDEFNDQIAMLMYLTGMDGIYWFSMGDSTKSGSRNTRTILYSSLSYHRCIGGGSSSDDRAGLCMIACK